MEVPLKIKTELPCDPVISLVGILPKINKITISKKSALPCLLSHCARLPRYGKNLSVHQRMNGSRKCGIYTKWDIIQSSQKGKTLFEIWMSLKDII